MVPDSSGVLRALGTIKRLFLGPDTKDRQGQPAGTKDTEQIKCRKESPEGQGLRAACVGLRVSETVLQSCSQSDLPTPVRSLLDPNNGPAK